MFRLLAYSLLQISNQLVNIFHEQRFLFLESAVRECRLEDSSHARVMRRVLGLHQVRHAVTGCTVPVPVFRRERAQRSFTLAAAVAVDVSPGIGVDEAKFVRSNAYSLAVASVQRGVVVVQITGP